MKPLSRRNWLAAAGAWGVVGAARSQAQAQTPADPPTGLVLPPQPGPALRLRTQDGRERELRQLLQGRITALQLMFTGCSTSCPAQGALFAALATAGLPARGQLLSVSIDALGDDPKSLSAWLARFGASASQWQAGVPAVRDVDPFADWLKGAPGRSGTHTAQVFLFDAQGRLRFRTPDEPPAQAVLALLKQLAAVS